MPLPKTMRAAVRRRLSKLEYAPWQDCWGVSVWRQPVNQFEFALGSQIINEPVIGLDDAVNFVMKHGWKE